MPPDRQPPQKRRRLPFNPPRMQSPTVAGPSSAAAPSSSKPKSTTTTTTKATKTTKPRTQSKLTKASSSSSTSKPASKQLTARKQKQKQPTTTEEASDNDDDASSPGGASSPALSGSDAQRDRSPSQEPDYILAEITHGEDPGENVALGEPTIPPKLLTKLLHHHFQNEKTKIAKDANEIVAKYVDVFVREALARAAYERSEGTGAGGASVADGFLEVEDLEKMAPQLVLDF